MVLILDLSDYSRNRNVIRFNTDELYHYILW